MKSSDPSARQLFLDCLDHDTPEERKAFLERMERELETPEWVSQARELLRAHEEAEAKGAFFQANPGWVETETLGGSSSEGLLQDAAGSQIGRYKLLEKIGEGGMGVVYMAEQEEPVRRKVALKIIKLGMDTKQVIARFEAERQALAMMDNPHIAKVLDAGATETGRPFFVMELVRGIAIDAFCDARRLSIEERLRLFRPVCQAIHHAHQKGVIHRDIKPSNILVTQNGGEPHPMVIDFGVAKAINQRLTEKTLFTRFAQMVGTPSYMSPEQAEMSIQDVDTRSDVYSLGILLYQLLTGTTPFPEERLLSVGYAEIQRILKEEEPVRPSTMMSQIGGKRSSAGSRCGAEPAALMKLFRGDLDWIVLKAIDKDRARRYESAFALAEDVRRHLENEPVVARPPTFGYQLQKGWRRNKLIYSAAGVVLLSLVMGLSVSLWQTWVATEAKRTAEAAEQREKVLRQDAVASEKRQRLLAYAADMRSAHQYLKENRLDQVELLLQRYVPQAGEDDLRGYYWRHLRQASQGDQALTLAHEAIVCGIALSKEGDRLASITASGKVRFYDTAAGDLLQSFGGGLMSYGAGRASVTLSSDGRWVASDQQGVLKVWQTETGQLVYEEEGISAPLRFSPDGKALVGLAVKGLKRWNTADWTESGQMQPPEGVVGFRPHLLQFLDAGSRLLLTPRRFSDELWIYHWDKEALEERIPCPIKIETVAVGGDRIAAGGSEGTVAVWEKRNGAHEMRTFTAHTDLALGLAFSPDGQWLATGGNEQGIYVWDVENLALARVLKGHHGQVWDLATSVAQNYLASASMDHSVKIWDWATIAELASLNAGDTSSEEKRRVSDSPSAIREDGERLAASFAVASVPDLKTRLSEAVSGDVIQLNPGEYVLEETLVVHRPVTLQGSVVDGQPGAILVAGPGVPVAVQVDTASEEVATVAGLTVRTETNGIQHTSGSMALRDLEVVCETSLDFKAAVSLEAKGRAEGVADRCLIQDCRLIVKDAGTTQEGTPPDVDVILGSSGARYEEVRVVGCTIQNDIPNAISNGIETRSMEARIEVRGNRVQCEGMGLVLPNHVGTMAVIDNVVGSGYAGVVCGIGGEGPNLISGNEITVIPREHAVYPVFVQELIAAQGADCIRIGSGSAGVTAGFFHMPFIPMGNHFLIEENTFKGQPQHGISLVNSTEPEGFGPPTANLSHDNVIRNNDFTALDATWDIALGRRTHDNVVYGNRGLTKVFKEFAAQDRNSVSMSGESAARYVAGEIDSASLAGNLLGDPSRRPFWVWLPPGYDSSPEKRYPTLYFLHGFTGDHHSMKHSALLGLRIGEIAQRMIGEGKMAPSILVLPHGANQYGGSFYARNEVVGDYRTYLGEELVELIDARYRTQASRESRSIAGNSMGGKGAFSLAMAYPEVFGAVAAMGPPSDLAVAPTFMEKFVHDHPKELGVVTRVHDSAGLRGLLRGQGDAQVNLLYARAAAYSPNPDNPPYYVDLPVSYPDGAIVEEVWAKWLEQDLVSEIGRDGEQLKDTRIFVDVGIGPTTIMDEVHDIDHLRRALTRAGLESTFVEGPGDHLSHLAQRLEAVLAFLVPEDRP